MNSIILSKCDDMCPSEEVKFRIEKRLVNRFEMDKNTKTPNPKFMVKEYRRSAAATDHLNPILLRTTKTLLRTIDYLLELYKNTTLLEKESFSAVYSFVTDRLRAVRQDMILQQCSPKDTQNILERMLPFYIVTEYICIVENCKEYNWKLHSTQLEECFSRWAETLLYILFH
ncbi:unnamed protein product, partial [Mesorhabditis belari]|uniref:SAC3/GANP/THP3 conserved domain-containing protein n=1 Tax=Mesorhabditis belari TaxID=2138241 RepID=A0AAF3E8G9_9BILA